MPPLVTNNWQNVMNGLEKVRGIAQVAHTLDVTDRLYVVQVMLNCAESWDELEAVSKAVENAKKRKSIQDTRNISVLNPVGLGFVPPERLPETRCRNANSLNHCATKKRHPEEGCRIAHLAWLRAV